ncbi:MAG TPA: hypothetical protein VH186_00810 [Chloroflexia bacterium]|nr:hypothetical protein [Chloroflexia bacterium]
MKEILASNYSLKYEEEQNTVTLSGSLRLNGPVEYEPISSMLNQAMQQEPPPPQFKLDLRQLQFLNSFGINMLSRFIISVRRQTSTRIVLEISREIPWQAKSLQNLQKLMPALELVYN